MYDGPGEGRDLYNFVQLGEAKSMHRADISMHGDYLGLLEE